MMAALPMLALLAPAPAGAVTPDDFQGTWVVKRVVGSSEALGSADPRKMLGTKLRWTATDVTDAEGVCKIVHATVDPVSNDMLEQDIWARQKISELNLPRAQIASAFGKDATPVFYDGAEHCAPAVMLNHQQMLLIFQNGYIYLLDRVGR